MNYQNSKISKILPCDSTLRYWPCTREVEGSSRCLPSSLEDGTWLVNVENAGAWP
jgi:hypothetical protein